MRSQKKMKLKRLRLHQRFIIIMPHVESKDDVLLTSLLQFYADPGHLRTLTDALNSKAISLRVLDWFTTNYSKRTNTCYVVRHYDEVKSFNVYLEYKSMLKGYSKRLFDPFSRRTRIDFVDADGRPVQTTIGQLHFFRWAITFGVLEFAIAHANEIETDMLNNMRQQATQQAQMGHPPGSSSRRPKRRELSKAAIKSLTNTKIILTLRFE